MENKKDGLIYIIIIIIILSVRTYIATPVRVNGTSMTPTLKDNDFMILNKLAKNDVKRFDIIVIKRNNDKLIKRLIGLPGETVEIRNGKLYIDGQYQEQKFFKEDTNDIDFIYEPSKDDCYFVMGDNRMDSLDSRYFGCVSKQDILGIADFVIFPFDNFGKQE